MNDGTKKLTVLKEFRRYWRANGSWHALLSSPYVGVALLITILAIPKWTSTGWWELTFQLVPNLLGFTLAGLAVFVAFGNQEFIAFLAGRDPEDPPEETSPYIDVCTKFVHFVLVQGLSLIVALIASALAEIAWPVPASLWMLNEVARGVLWAFGFFLVAYGLLASVAAVMSVYNFVHLFDDYQTEEREKKRS